MGDRTQPTPPPSEPGRVELTITDPYVPLSAEAEQKRRARVDAIFVDATGHTKSATVEPVWRISFPIPTRADNFVRLGASPPKPERSIGDFVYVGELPDRRRVYVQDGFGLRLGWTRVLLSNEFLRDPRAAEYSDTQADQAIRHITAGPVWLIYDVTSPKPGEHLSERLLYFVGKQTPEQSAKVSR